MPLFLLTEWKWILPTLAAGFFALMWGITGLQLANLKASVADAERIATAQARAQDELNSRLANEIDRVTMEKRDALDKAESTARDLARTRGLYVRAKSSCMPGAASDTGHGEAGTSEVRLSDDTSEWLIAFAKRADAAAIYGQQCHEWAMKVGK